MVTSYRSGGQGWTLGGLFDLLRRFARWLRGRRRVDDIEGGAADDSRTGLGPGGGVRGGHGQPRSNHDIIAELKWRAACELVEWLGGLSTPRQLRKHFDEIGDPTVAVTRLVKDLGCDINRLGRGDADERDRFLESLEMLVHLDDHLATAPPRIRTLVAELFRSNGIARLRTLSEVAARLATARGLCEDAADLVGANMACVTRHRALVDKAIAEMDAVSAEDAEQACNIAAGYLRAAETLSAAHARWETALDRIGRAAPPDWTRAKAADLKTLDRRLADVLSELRKGARLSPAAVRKIVERLEAAAAGLEGLADQAEAAGAAGRATGGAGGGGGGGRKRSGGGGSGSAGGHASSADQWREILGFPPGSSPSVGELIAAYRALAKKHHPDRNPGDPAASERMAKINDAYDKLKAYIHGGRSA